jgi:hypothetical protein
MRVPARLSWPDVCIPALQYRCWLPQPRTTHAEMGELSHGYFGQMPASLFTNVVPA